MNWNATLGAIGLLLGSLLPSTPTDAQSVRCQVQPFTGASSPNGAVATMRVVNDGQPCSVTLYGVPAERRNPATGGVILQPPKHGKAEFVDARLQYTPEPGYVGNDEFSSQAWATGETRTRSALKIRMKVQVLAKM